MMGARQASLENGEGLGVVAVAWSFAGVGTVLMALRAYVRLSVTTGGEWALFWACCSWVRQFALNRLQFLPFRAGADLIKATLVVSMSVATVAVHYGLGNHIGMIEQAGEETARRFLLFTWLAITMFYVSIPLLKIAVSSFLVEVLGTTRMSVCSPLSFQELMLQQIQQSGICFTLCL